MFCVCLYVSVCIYTKYTQIGHITIAFDSVPVWRDHEVTQFVLQNVLSLACVNKVSYLDVISRFYQLAPISLLSVSNEILISMSYDSSLRHCTGYSFQFETLLFNRMLWCSSFCPVPFPLYKTVLWFQSPPPILWTFQADLYRVIDKMNATEWVGSRLSLA